MGVKKSGKTAVVVPMERITQTILLRRGHKVILDDDLAVLYEVETKTLNRAVKRNRDRFRTISCSSLPPRSSTT